VQNKQVSVSLIAETREEDLMRIRGSNACG